MEKEFRLPASENIFLKESTLLNNLCLTYTAENYCLRRIPRLVKIVEISKLSQLLSDHVSVIMDRLNFLDEILSNYKLRPSFRSLTNQLEDRVRIFSKKDDKKNQELITNLIEVSQYRYPLYEFLVSATTNKAEAGTCARIIQILNQEEKFYQDLNTIKREIVTINRVYNFNIQLVN